MLICKNCGAKLADSSKKCYACGTPVTKETTEYVDPFQDDKAKASGPSAQTDSPAQPGNIWEQRYGKNAENKKQSYADFDWQEDGDVFDQMAREQMGPEKAPTDEQLLIGPGALRYSMKFKSMREKNQLFNWNWGAFLLGPIWFGYRKMYPMAIVTLVLGFLCSFFNQSLALVFSIIIDVLMGLFADRIYLEHIAGLLKRTENLDQHDKISFIRRKGGVGVWFVLLIFLIYWIVSMLQI